MPGWVAGDTISKIIYPFFQVLFLDLNWIMGMAVGTGVILVCLRVTGLAGDFAFLPMIQRERVIA